MELIWWPCAWKQRKNVKATSFSVPKTSLLAQHQASSMQWGVETGFPSQTTCTDTTCQNGKVCNILKNWLLGYFWRSWMVVQVLLTFSSDAKDLCCPTLKLLDATYFSAKVVLTQLKKGAFFGELAVMFVTLALLGVGLWQDLPCPRKLMILLSSFCDNFDCLWVQAFGH